MIYRSLRGAILASTTLSAALLSPPALAQSADHATAAAVASPADTSATADDGATIVVTGSRIARPEIDLPNPVVAITAAAIQQSGRTNLTDYLTQIPALAGSTTGNMSAGSNADFGESGLNLLSLRNLGTNRTLVLVDGRRHVGALDSSAAVDINTIPTDLVERIDVLTGGASAVYGADGVSGVVNFVMKHDFEGVTARAQSGISQHGDGANQFVAVTAGKNFAEGKGNVAIAYEYNREHRLDELKRRYLRNPHAGRLVQNPDDLIDDPRVPDNIPLRDLRYADSSPGGAVDINPFDAAGNFDPIPDFTGDGRVYDRGRLLPNSGGYTQGGSSTPIDGYQGDVLPGVKRHSVNAFAHYEFSPAFNLFAEGKYVLNKSHTESQPLFDFYLLQLAENPYMPDAIRDAITPGNLSIAGLPDGVVMTRDDFDLGTQAEDARRETIRGVIGVNGKVSDHARYEVSYVYGQTRSRITTINNRYNDRFAAAIDVVTDPATGLPTCRINLPGASLVDPFSYNYPAGGGPVTFRPGECKPLNLFGNGSPSNEAVDWVMLDTVSRSKVVQHVATAQLTGDFGALFELPGGPVGFAIGAEWRREKSFFDPSAEFLAGTTYYGALTRQRGSFEVKEAFAELNVPVLKHVPFAETLTFDAALRLSDYTTVGKTTTWKFDGVWAPIRDIRFRATLSQAVRAPNIGELFGATNTTFEFITDPCDIQERNNGSSFRQANCVALLRSLDIDPASFNPSNDPQANISLPGTTSGNPDLSEEKARTWTAGVTLEPRFLPGLSMSLDWYDIKLKQAISQPTAQELAGLCVDQPTLTNIYCGLVDRSTTTGFINGFRVRPENVAAFHTAGAELNFNYLLRTRAVGDFNLRVIGSYLDTLSFVPTVGADAVEDQNIANESINAPKFQVTADLTWTKGALTLNYGLSWWSKTYRYSREIMAGNPDYVPARYLKYKERWEHEVYASYDVDRRFTIYGGINNLFDQKPDFGASFYPVSAVGRYFYTGVKVKLADLM